MKVPEAFLQWVWHHQVFNSTHLKTTDGRTVRVECPGSWNRGFGPDFSGARLWIGNHLSLGAVEIHVRSTDWFEHGHEHDVAYNSVILHVIQEDCGEIACADHHVPPQLILGDRILPQAWNVWNHWMRNPDHLSCRNHLSRLNNPQKENGWLEISRMQAQERIRMVFQGVAKRQGNWEQAFLAKLFSSWGFHHHSEPFAEIFQAIPPTLLQRLQGNGLALEALLLGLGRFLEDPQDEYAKQLKSMFLHLQIAFQLKKIDPFPWKNTRLRPSNFPEFRLAQLAAILNQTTALFGAVLGTSSKSQATELLNVRPNPYWNNHYRMGNKTNEHSSSLGEKSKQIILANTLIPFRMAYFERVGNHKEKEATFHWMNAIPAEENAITAIFKDTPLQPKNLKDGQAMVHLYKNFCVSKRCFECPFGTHLLQFSPIFEP
jgi:hypothetical protein